MKEAASSFGAGYVSGPVTFIFEKVCVFLPEEVKTREVPVEEVKAEEPAKTEEPVKTEEPAKTEEPVKTEETSGEKEKEIVEETKKEEIVATSVVEEKKPEVEKEEEKKPVVEEVKKEEAAPAPAVVETPVTAPETTTPAPVAEPPKPWFVSRWYDCFLLYENIFVRNKKKKKRNWKEPKNLFSFFLFYMVCLCVDKSLFWKSLMRFYFICIHVNL